MKEGVIILAVACGNRGQAVAVQGPRGGTGSIVFANPIGQRLVEMEARQIEIVVVQVQLFLKIQLAFEEAHHEILDRHRTCNVIRRVGFGTGSLGPLNEFSQITLVTGPEGFQIGDGFAHPLGTTYDVRWVHLAAKANPHEGLVPFLLPFIGDANNGIGALVILENPKQLRESAAISGGHAVDFIEDNAEGAMSLRSEKVTHIGRIQKGFDELGHGGLVSELTGVAFYGSESGVVDHAMGQCGFADTWRAKQECNTGFTGNGLSYPG